MKKSLSRAILLFLLCQLPLQAAPEDLLLPSASLPGDRYVEFYRAFQESYGVLNAAYVYAIGQRQSTPLVLGPDGAPLTQYQSQMQTFEEAIVLQSAELQEQQAHLQTVCCQPSSSPKKAGLFVLYPPCNPPKKAFLEAQKALKEIQSQKSEWEAAYHKGSQWAPESIIRALETLRHTLPKETILPSNSWQEPPTTPPTAEDDPEAYRLYQLRTLSFQIQNAIDLLQMQVQTHQPPNLENLELVHQYLEQVPKKNRRYGIGKELEGTHSSLQQVYAQTRVTAPLNGLDIHNRLAALKNKMLKKPSLPAQAPTLEGEEELACTYAALVQDLRIWMVQQLMGCLGLAEKHFQAARNARSQGEEPPSTGALGEAIYVHKLCKNNLLELRKLISQGFLMLDKHRFSVQALEAADLVLNNLALAFVNSKTLIDPAWLGSKVANKS